MAATLLNNSQLDAKLRFQFPDIDLNLLKSILGSYAWTWFSEHQNDVIVKKWILFFSVTIQVKHLKVLFEGLFGSQPAFSGGF